MSDLKRTIFYDRHKALGAKIVEFSGWEMPIFYPSGILEEHLATRKKAGLFDVSHMGRFIVKGTGALKFLQHVLTNNAEALNISETGAQYTLIPNENGGAVDDAYLYRFVEEEYLLVVNAANREKDWEHLNSHLKDFQHVEIVDKTSDIAMIALQGPMSRYIMEKIIESSQLPEPVRNAVNIVTISGSIVKLARTGYTGEPLCFELFINRDDAPGIWDQIISKGATPIGLGARDTLRLEAGLPLYGHEFGIDHEGKEIPILSCPVAKFAVSFSSLKGNYIGYSELIKQHNAFKKIVSRDYSLINDLPRMNRPITITGRGIARKGAKVFKGEKHIGYITSGTMVPLWTVEGEGLSSLQTNHHQLRSICLGYIDSNILDDEKLTIEIRGKAVDAVVVKHHMRSEAPPYARPIVFDQKLAEKELPIGDTQSRVSRLLEKTLENTLWRQKSCINLIPSEMTTSPMTRLLSVMDPTFRYAEHKKSIAFYDADIFYYQGTDFICKVEQMLEEEMRKFLGCNNVETRLISGQMANTAVFSAMIDFINRADRKSEPRRIRQVMHNHIGKGGHLSAQPMGALKDYVARNPRTEKPAVVNFPVLTDNPFKIDVPKTLKLIDEYRPELIIFGKSMVIHKEPVAEIRQFLDTQAIKSVIMYDMAHVLGLIGPHFQQPFAEGADIVTGSTHKTFFGTQRGVAGTNFEEHEELYTLWEALVRRTFPGSVSNHHLGTLLGLLMAAYEMNYFKDTYQSKVIANAKTFARALKDCGLNVAGDSAIDFTETHQVLIHVGYSRGPEIARQLETNNIICNYQASTDEEGFTASGALRMGVSEMTRFGMEEKDFQLLASLIHEVVMNNGIVVDQIKKLREKCSTLKFCFSDRKYDDLLQKLHGFL